MLFKHLELCFVGLAEVSGKIISVLAQSLSINTVLVVQQTIITDLDGDFEIVKSKERV